MFLWKIYKIPIFASNLRVSPHHLVPCASSGIPSLDTLVLGGGLPIGYWLSVSSDVPSVYAKLFPQFFLAEGAEMEQVLFVAGRGARQLSTELPHSTDSQEKAAEPNEKLEIAWAYQNQPKHRASHSSRFGHYWDVSTARDPQKMAGKLHVVDTDDFTNPDDFLKVDRNIEKPTGV